MLALAYDHVRQANFRLVNLDCVVAAELPKLSPYKEAMRERIAQVLDVETHQINLKAKTGEGIGPVGEQQIIEARCVALLETGH